MGWPDHHPLKIQQLIDLSKKWVERYNYSPKTKTEVKNIKFDAWYKFFKNRGGLVKNPPGYKTLLKIRRILAVCGNN